MNQTPPTVDMSGGAFPNAFEDAQGAMAGSGAPPEPSPFVPSPKPTRPLPPSAPEPGPSPEAGGAHTVWMTAPPSGVPLAWLGVVSGPGAARGQTFVLSPETIIGRKVGSLLLSTDKTVSSQHAKIRLEPKEGGAQGEQVFVIYDLTSANGTFVGTRETVNDSASRVYRRELHSGEYILLGETMLVFWQA